MSKEFKHATHVLVGLIETLGIKDTTEVNFGALENLARILHHEIDNAPKSILAYKLKDFLTNG